MEHALVEEISEDTMSIQENGDIEALIGRDELMLSFYMQIQLESMNFDYDKFMMMSRDEKVRYMNNLVDKARDFVREHNISIESSKKKYLYVSPELSFYLHGLVGPNYELNDHLNMDIDVGEVMQTNISILTDDKNDSLFEVSLDDIIEGRYTTPLGSVVSLYVEGSVDSINGTIYLETGVTESVSLGTSGFSIPIELSCGVEIYSQSVDPFDNDPLGSYTYDDLMEMHSSGVNSSIPLWLVDIVEYCPILLIP